MFFFFIYNFVSVNVFLLNFKILDFMTVEEAKANFDADRHERGFRKIAWAFLKVKCSALKS